MTLTNEQAHAALSHLLRWWANQRDTNRPVTTESLTQYFNAYWPAMSDTDAIQIAKGMMQLLEDHLAAGPPH